MFTSKKQMRLISALTVIMFIGATMGAYAGGPSTPVAKPGLFSKGGATTQTTTTTAKGGTSSKLFGAGTFITGSAVAIGTDFAIRMIKGERPSLSKAQQIVTSSEFMGTSIGSVLGAAGGQIAGVAAKAILPGPIGAIAGTLLTVAGGTLGARIGGNMATDYQAGKLDPRTGWQKIDKWDLAGTTIGSTLGMMLGSMIPIPFVGSMVGGMVGGWLGSKVAAWMKQGTRFGSLTNPFNNNSITYPVSGSNGVGITMGNGGSQIGVGAGFNPGGPVGIRYDQGAPAQAPQGTSANIQAAEQAYYNTYLQYNKALEAGDNAGAQKLQEQLKTYAEQYQALKSGIK